MDHDGNVYLVYTKNSTLDLLFRKLSFNIGAWSVGSEVTVYNDKDNYFPSLIRDFSGKLTLCWTCYDSVQSKYYIRCKTSTNDGGTWGAGPADAGEALTSGSSGCYCQVVYLGVYIYCVYTDGGTNLSYRRKVDGAALWDSAQTLYSGSGLDDSLSVAISESGAMVGVAFKADSKLWFMEYDTENWSSPFEIALSFDTPPLLLFNGAIPYVFYGVNVGTGQTEVRYRYKSGSGFNVEAVAHQQLACFEYVLLYDADGSPTFQNLTDAASDSTAADVFHPSSNKMIHAAGDALYLGSAEKFAAVRVLLSTAGDAGGVVEWSYYDGSQWVSFTPDSGAYNFDQADKLVRLWEDTASAPATWQKNQVDGKTRYWIKAEVTNGYNTAPVGSQLTPLTNINYLNQ